MRWLPDGPDRSVRSQLAIVLTLALIASLTVIVPAFAGHPEATLPGSNFEIDEDANLKVDDPDRVDWANAVGAIHATDAETGKNDDSYKGGVKEDTECPGETTGSIPNNKSDLLTFHVYVEEGSGGHPGFLNMAWSRVSDPSGTTLMDFEFNQSTVPCPQGPNVQRTPGDLLIEYRIEQGGARADLAIREWTGSAWGPPDEDLGDKAVGTINQTVIPQGESSVLGVEKQPRTFGEAQIDLTLLFDEGKCTSFGSAMLKSRSSASFTSQLKDFIRPEPIELTNCGKVIIRKVTDPAGADAVFGFTKSFDTDPDNGDTFTLSDGESETFNNVLFGTEYTVTEDDIPDDWAFDSVDCDASEGVDFNIDGATVTFDIDSEDDVLDCTYFNSLQTGAIEITKTRKHAADGAGDHAHEGVDFTIDGETVTTGEDGTVCLDGLSFGDYTVTEITPSGYAPNEAETVNVSQTSTCGDGDEATVSFSNTPLTDLLVRVTSQVDGGTISSIVCFDEADDEIGSDGVPSLVDPAEVDVKDLEPGTYTCTIIIDP